MYFIYSHIDRSVSIEGNYDGPFRAREALKLLWIHNNTFGPMIAFLATEDGVEVDLCEEFDMSNKEAEKYNSP